LIHGLRKKLYFRFAVAEWSKVPEWELRFKVVDPIPSKARNFSTPGCKKKSTRHPQPG